MEVAEDVLEFHLTKNTNVSQQTFSQWTATNSFTYVPPSTCIPSKSIEIVPKGAALPLRRICYSDKKFDERSVQYQKYLLARDYKASKVKKEFSDVRNIP